MKSKLFSPKSMAKIAILSALATIIYLLEQPIPLFPEFYKLDLSEIVILMGGFALGPLSAVVIEIIKMILNLLINGTITMGIGELSNFLVGCSFVVPASVIYKRKKNFKGALIGLLSGVISIAVTGAVLNWLVLIPAYAFFAGFSVESIIKLSNSVNSNITDMKTLILFATIPFNLIKAVICSVVTLLLYKRVSPILHK